MRAVSFLSGKMLDAMVRAFRAKYPFLDVHVEEQGGSVEAAQRFLLEIKAGMAKNWDANRLWTELYDEYLPHQKKFDIDLLLDGRSAGVPSDFEERQTIANDLGRFQSRLTSCSSVQTWLDALSPSRRWLKVGVCSGNKTITYARS
jgi:hypothetical protein